MFVEPLAAFRQTTARPQRTKIDWAIEVAHRLDTRSADCDAVTLVCDNLDTQTKGRFYEAFPADQARASVKRIDFVHTPQHGSWFNVAECELSRLTGRRIGEIEKLQTKIKAWSQRTNAASTGNSKSTTPA